MQRRHNETLRRLRVAADESHVDAIDHIMVKETRNPLGANTKWGGNAPLCSPAIDADSVESVQPYITSSPRLCRACEHKLVMSKRRSGTTPRVSP